MFPGMGRQGPYVDRVVGYDPRSVEMDMRAHRTSMNAELNRRAYYHAHERDIAMNQTARALREAEEALDVADRYRDAYRDELDACVIDVITKMTWED